MFPPTFFSRQTIAFSALTLLHATSEIHAAITLSMSETRVSRVQPVVQGQTEGIVAVAGAPVDTRGADAFFALDYAGVVLTVDVGIGLESGGGTFKMMIDSGVRSGMSLVQNRRLSESELTWFNTSQSPNFWVASNSCRGCEINSAVRRYTVNTTSTYREAPYGRALLPYGQQRRIFLQTIGSH
jgi:hypothetical protein